MSGDHEPDPKHSVLYDNYRCATCNIRIYWDTSAKQWAHPAWANKP